MTHLVHLLSSAVGDDVLGRWLRRALLRTVGAQLADTASLHGGTYLSNPSNLRVGARSLVNRSCYLDLEGPISIGDDVVIGHGVTVVTAVHELGPRRRRAGDVTARPVSIAAGAWVGADVVILPGTTIGEGAVVGAGSVVTHDVPPDTMVVGSPARAIRRLDEHSGGSTQAYPDKSAHTPRSIARQRRSRLGGVVTAVPHRPES